MHNSEDRRDGWSEDHDHKLIDLRSHGVPWKDIAGRLGRTVEACCARYRILVPAAYRRRIAKGARWTEAEEATLAALVQEGRRPRQIASFMGKNLQAIYSKIQQMRAPGRGIQIDLEPRAWAPQHVLEDRDRRDRAVCDLTALLCGDPKPGQSALDKKQGAFA